MGMGPVPATRKVLAKAQLAINQMNVIELNEALPRKVSLSFANSVSPTTLRTSIPTAALSPSATRSAPAVRGL